MNLISMFCARIYPEKLGGEKKFSCQVITACSSGTSERVCPAAVWTFLCEGLQTYTGFCQRGNFSLEIWGKKTFSKIMLSSPVKL